MAFPRTSQAGRPAGGGLPVELTSFVGREREIDEVENLLAGTTRLLTLTGPGGCGKTRLALEVARGLAERFWGGARWVGLASLGDPDLVPKLVASALGVREQPGRTPTEALADHLQSSEILLVLDNCEHLVEACAALADALLRACPNLKVLATSREALGIAGETNWSVPALSLPAADHRLSGQELTRYEAVRLFAERAAATLPGFTPTEENAVAVARVCRELDGIPLAIELAAARVRVLTVEQIAERLGDHFGERLADPFGLLAAGSRAAVPRQRTLRATIDWSHGLLSEEERALFRRLSVFAGGFTLEAAEGVCSGGDIEKGEVFDLLSRLVEKSLISTEERDARARYRFLETIRQYGAEKLRESGEAEATGRSHADHFLSLAEEAEPAMAGPGQTAWMARLVREHNNLRAALGWLEEAREAERGLRLSVALLRFWWFGGHLAEGRIRIEALLDLPGASIRDEVRAKALRALGVMIYRQTDYGARDRAAARSRLEEALGIYRRLNDDARVAEVLQDLGRADAEFGDLEAAILHLEESLMIGRRLADKSVVAFSLYNLGLVRMLAGDLPEARARLEEALVVYQELDDRFWIAAISLYTGYVDCKEGDHAAARSRFARLDETLPLVRFPWSVPYVLEGFAWVAAALGHPKRALGLGGAADALRRTVGVSFGPAWRADSRRGLAPAWRSLNEEEGEAAWEEGRAMTLEAALAFALEEPEKKPTRPDEPLGGPLSAREVEVLRLVSEGLTDVQAAERLYLSPRTVGQHLRSIYRKLGVPSRAAAARRAVELGLI